MRYDGYLDGRQQEKNKGREGRANIKITNESLNG
jgi:hypothetical protein